jgi:pimeloyl-ACP methyl ester carboxylesterase
MMVTITAKTASEYVASRCAVSLSSRIELLEGRHEMSDIKYNRVEVDGFRVAYREAGPVNGPALLLLHGFPTSSHMFRNLIPKLADRYRVVAPDLPGFGQSDLPSRERFKYTFSNLAKVMSRFTELLKLNRFAMYIFDYGAPTGLRMAVEHPDRVTAIITQNGNAYVEGLSDGWNPIRAYWKGARRRRNRDALRLGQQRPVLPARRRGGFQA